MRRRRQRRLRRRYGHSQTSLAFGGTITDVLGETRAIEKTWPVTDGYPSGGYECPFCHYPVRGQGACENPACSANAHNLKRPEHARPAFEKIRQQAAERKAEEERRQRDQEWSQRYHEERRVERERKINDIVEQAKQKGACVRCALKDAPWRVKLVKHRGACPLERR